MGHENGAARVADAGRHEDQLVKIGRVYEMLFLHSLVLYCLIRSLSFY